MLRMLQLSSWEAVSKVVQLNLQSTSPHCRQPYLILNFMSNHTDTHYWLVGRGNLKNDHDCFFHENCSGPEFWSVPSLCCLTKANLGQEGLLAFSADTKQQQSEKQEFVPTQSSKRPFIQSGLLLHFWVLTQLRGSTDCLRQWTVKIMQVQKRHTDPIDNNNLI